MVQQDNVQCTWYLSEYQNILRMFEGKLGREIRLEDAVDGNKHAFERGRLIPLRRAMFVLPHHKVLNSDTVSIIHVVWPLVCVSVCKFVS